MAETSSRRDSIDASVDYAGAQLSRALDATFRRYVGDDDFSPEDPSFDWQTSQNAFKPEAPFEFPNPVPAAEPVVPIPEKREETFPTQSKAMSCGKWFLGISVTLLVLACVALVFVLVSEERSDDRKYLGPEEAAER